VSVKRKIEAELKLKARRRALRGAQKLGAAPVRRVGTGLSPGAARVAGPTLTAVRMNPARGIKVLDCKIINCGTGIWADNVEGLEVSGTTFINNGTDIVGRNLRGAKIHHNRHE